MKKKRDKDWIQYHCFRNSGISISCDIVRITIRSGYVSALDMYMVRVYQPVTSRNSAVRAFSPPSCERLFQDLSRANICCRWP